MLRMRHCLLAFALTWTTLVRAEEPRPSQDDAQEGARRLLGAIAQDDPSLAEAFFFPRDAFRKVKAIASPDRYWDKLHARFVRDIHALHASLPANAELVRLALGTRGGWVAPGEEGNKLGYWAARHAWLHYRVGAVEHKLEVRVLISWQQHWYVIHLNEFH